MTIFYEFEGKLYANITNKCPCACRFCIRNGGDSIAGNSSLWLEHEPSVEEIKRAFDSFDKQGLSEVVFCGYGEPMERADALVEVARYIKQVSTMKIRVNTNGLVKLIMPDFDVSSLAGVVDSVSISLNASDSDKYDEITRPKFKGVAYDAMLSFSEKVKELGINVGFTVVDMGGMEEEIIACHKRAEGMGIPLRVRAYVTDNESYT